jgi:hypothetical protein
MNKAAALAVLGAFVLPVVGFAQTPGRPGTEFQITKITRALIAPPEFTYNGAQNYRTDQRERWLEVEVEFASAPELAEEVTVKYYLALNGKLLTGEVTHVNVAAGREHRSVMYVPPKTIARLMGNRPLTATSIQNIAAQIVQQGAVKSEVSLERAAPQWFASVPQLGGLMLNKNETPFAPLYWDRYEQIKSASR